MCVCVCVCVCACVCARVCVKGKCSESFTVRNGVRKSFTKKNGVQQGCIIAPILFNLYFCSMVADWRKQCPRASVTFFYCHERNRTTAAEILCYGTQVC